MGFFDFVGVNGAVRTWGGDARIAPGITTPASPSRPPGYPPALTRVGALTSIGFLGNSFLSAYACLRPAFLRASPLLFLPTLLLVHLGRLGLFPGWGDGCGPLTRSQNPHRKRLGLKQQRQQHQPPAHDTTQAANGQLTSGSLALLTGDMPTGQRLAWLVLLALLLMTFLGLAAQTQTPDLRHGHRQPEPFDPTGMRHFRMMPPPQSPFEIFEPRFDPGSQPVPTDLGRLGLQIGQHDPWGLVAHFPMQQQRSRDPNLFACKALHSSLPTRPRRRHPSTDPLKRFLSHRPGFDPQIEPQERMPAARPDGVPQPAGIQPTISEHHHLPLIRDGSLQLLEQSFPMRTPRAFSLSRQHFPRHRNR